MSIVRIVAGVLGALLPLVCAVSHAVAQDSVPRRFRVNTTDDTVDVNPGDGVCADASGSCSLRAAVQEANASGEPTEIILRPGAGYTLLLDGQDDDAGATGDLDVTGDITIRGGGKLRRSFPRSVRGDFGSGAILNADRLSRILDVHEGARLSLIGVRLTGGGVIDEGGGSIRSSGSVRLERVMVVASSAVGTSVGTGTLGGAIFNDGGTLTVRASDVDGEALDGGGAIASRGGVTTIDHCRLGGLGTEGGILHVVGDGQVSVRRSTLAVGWARRGGAIWNASEGTTIDSCVFRSNTAFEAESAADGGAAIFNEGGTLTITRTRFVGNGGGLTSVPQAGGGIRNVSGTLDVERCLFRFNDAFGAGGGIATNGGRVTVTRSRFIDNRGGQIAPIGPVTGGGGIHITGDAVVTVDRCRFAENVSGTEGGAIRNSQIGNLTITRTTMRRNLAARDGGGAVYDGGGTVVIEDSRIARNAVLSEGGAGGGVHTVGGSLTLRRTALVGNLCGLSGGGIEVAGDGEATLEDVAFRRNNAVLESGGALHVGGPGTVTVTGGLFRRNHAETEGGGLWNSATGTIVVTRARIGRNRAPTGPDLFNAGGTFTIDGEAVPVGGD